MQIDYADKQKIAFILFVVAVVGIFNIIVGIVLLFSICLAIVVTVMPKYSKKFDSRSRQIITRNSKVTVKIIRNVFVYMGIFGQFFGAVVGLIVILGTSWLAYEYYQGNPEVNQLFCSGNIAQVASDSVVKIEGDQASGSGIILEDGYILTNNHVTFFNPNLRVGSNGAIVVATDSLHDLALINAELNFNEQPITISDRDPEITEEVYVIGYPGGQPNVTITKGIVSAYQLDEYDDRTYIQTDGAINPGNSGGPLVNTCGELVGLTTSSLRRDQNIGFAITRSQLIKFTDELKKQATNKFVSLGKESVPSARAEAVAKYYLTLSEGYFDIAYDSFSTQRQARLPRDNWIAGLKRTSYIRLRTVELLNIVGAPKGVDTVKVSFVAGEYQPDYTFKQGEYEGTWTVIEEDGQLKLDESNIKELSATYY